MVRQMELGDAYISADILSNLFFNHENLNYIGAQQDGHRSDSGAVREALRKDAVELLGHLGFDVALNNPAQGSLLKEMVDDFLGRL